MSNILKKLGVKDVFYIDIGSHHPVFGNNTYLLYKNGGHGILVEPNAGLCEAARSKRPRDIVVNAGAGREDGQADFYSFAKKSTRSSFSYEQAKKWEDESGQHPEIGKRQIFSLDTIIGKYASGRVPDAVCIDAEGLDKEILSGFGWKVLPKVFCIERSLGLEDILGLRGYELKARILQNDIYALKDS
ncbi:FkbM family methyltransferase [Candidatus Parcubacteria bacterium]|nr:FkbM family methyltransferase [Candidatus Parcubacteria bacterium]